MVYRGMRKKYFGRSELYKTFFSRKPQKMGLCCKSNKPFHISLGNYYSETKVTKDSMGDAKVQYSLNRKGKQSDWYKQIKREPLKTEQPGPRHSK